MMGTSLFVATESGVDTNNKRGPWVQTNSGKRFYPLDPRAEEVDIKDIAKALSKIARFNGHVDRFYSVAEHSIRVAQLVKEDKLEALLHDSTEAYIGDLTRPLKYVLPKFLEIEEKIWKEVSKRFQLKPLTEEINKADNLMCAVEKRDIFPKSEEWFNFPTEADVAHIPELQPLEPREAEELFLDLFYKYK